MRPVICEQNPQTSAGGKKIKLIFQSQRTQDLLVLVLFLSLKCTIKTSTLKELEKIYRSRFLNHIDRIYLSASCPDVCISVSSF